MYDDGLAAKLDQYRQDKESALHGAAVLIPIIPGNSGQEVLLEVRATTLTAQPGEACLPGGKIEPGESPQEAAIRETCEELLVSSDQIHILGYMGLEPGPSGRSLHVFVGTLDCYEGTFAPAEVDHTFTMSLDWLTRHEPKLFEVSMRPEYPDDFPWELVPNGRDYAWRTQKNVIPFYVGADPVVWGATARILMRFARLLRD